jgi:hypothetical protein
MKVHIDILSLACCKMSVLCDVLSHPRRLFNVLIFFAFFEGHDRCQLVSKLEGNPEALD